MNKKILKKLWSNYFRLQGLLETGVAGLTDLILSLDELLSGREPHRKCMSDIVRIDS